MKIKIQWKKDFLDQQWYKDHPAEIYLTEEHKKYMLQLFEQGHEDLDSEAEVIIEDTDT